MPARPSRPVPAPRDALVQADDVEDIAHRDCGPAAYPQPTASRDWLARLLSCLTLGLLALLVYRASDTPPEASPHGKLQEQTSHPPGSVPQPLPPTRLTRVDHAWEVTSPVQDEDLWFQVYVTSSDLAFDFSQVDRLSLAGRPAALSDALLTPVFQQSMATCKAMVVLGTASQEGATQTELRRALQRAEHVQYHLWSSGRLDCPLYTLNLGRARATQAASADPEATAHQRRLVVVTVLDAADDTLARPDRLRAALHRALGRLDGLPVDPVRDYASFDLTRKH